MLKEAKLLKAKSLSSLTLCIELFNRPSDVGRTDSVLMLLDHSFEMLLKASLLHRGARIREPGEKNTIGFDACVRRALSGLASPILTDEQALVLQAINGLRDAAQHHLLDISEGHLYLQTQSGVTLYRDLLGGVFAETLSEQLPDRVLPIATMVPQDPINLFLDELAEIAKMLEPGKRRREEASAKLRALSIVDGAMLGERLQPSEGDLKKLITRIAGGEADLSMIFPGIAAITFTTEENGATVNLRIVKREGIPVTLVAEGAANSSVVSVKRVNELGFYNLRFKDLHEKLDITSNQASALIKLLDIKGNEECAKLIIHTWCYSQKALTALSDALARKPVAEWWTEYRALRKVDRAVA